ncbi:MAG TPA: hypothetical protein DCG49_08400 [Ruminococcus sp.]|nr:hypothetical protein [Ruminococcus sp.]
MPYRHAPLCRGSMNLHSEHAADNSEKTKSKVCGRMTGGQCVIRKAPEMRFFPDTDKTLKIEYFRKDGIG